MYRYLIYPEQAKLMSCNIPLRFQCKHLLLDKAFIIIDSFSSYCIITGYQHIRIYDLNSNNPKPVINYDGISKNVTAVGFHEEGKWMYTGGEDNSARIWDLR